MARIAYLPSDLTEPRDVIEAIRARRGGDLLQVDRLLLHSPRLAAGWNAWVGAVRTPALVSSFLKELATCAVAFLNDAEFEIVRHSPAFLREGGSQSQLEALRDVETAARDAKLFDASQRAVLSLAYEMTRKIRVRAETFARVADALGNNDQAILELIAIIGTYNGWNRVLVALEVEAYGGDPL